MIRPIMMRTTIAASIVGDDKGQPRKLRAKAVGAPTILQITMLETTADAIAVRVRVAQHRLHLRRRTIMVTMASDTVNPDFSELGTRGSAVPALLGPLPFFRLSPTSIVGYPIIRSALGLFRAQRVDWINQGCAVSGEEAR